jgi:tetratricopeptide (TPR) repeat protein
MGRSCHYHPTKPALWVCPECELNYCGDCIDSRVVVQYGKKNLYYFCPECNVTAERIAFEDTVVPFWNRLPQFFAYPFHPRPIGLIIVLSIVFIFFLNLPLFRFWGCVLTGAVFFKYAFASLRSTANGSLTPPRIESDILFKDLSIVFKQLGILFVIGFAVHQLQKLAGMTTGVLVLYCAILFIPAMIIMLVGTGSLLQSVNPLLFVGMAWRIGWSYLLMCLFLMILTVAPFFLGYYILVGHYTLGLPPFLSIFLFLLSLEYYAIIFYHLMGYVIFQYHEEIGYDVDFVDEETPSKEKPGEQDDVAKLLNRVDMLIKEGKLDDAILLIKSETGGAISDLNLAERYYNLLKIKEEFPDMLEHGKVYLDLLAKGNQKEKLSEVYSECISQDDRFAPKPMTLLKVASTLNESGKSEESIKAYHRFVKANPENPLVPKAYFLVSNIFNEKLNNPGKAARILKGVIKKYPNHDIIPHVQRYLTQIKGP